VIQHCLVSGTAKRFGRWYFDRVNDSNYGAPNSHVEAKTMRFSFVRPFYALALYALVLAGQLSSQTLDTFTGEVTDASGAASGLPAWRVQHYRKRCCARKGGLPKLRMGSVYR
jgi:hypothetical protein